MDSLLQLMSDPNAWVAFLTLSALEIILGIDNIIFISVIANRLPVEIREKVRQFGLSNQNSVAAQPVLGDEPHQPPLQH